ncbi:3-carboxy-cis,cis-mucoante lactonizing enzyme [Auricularia subglabra TFB-10046 SS5]|uniref:3-carboxy-cis,cis-mucoante lactonizing enzyme n=1 Tax=Auricularia subglabra (strain TFB-10046 / SS5) TaxID=717982 RepID=J0WTY7_AURST|nr:3-carboxy-cis,cis-mucoante lactonizing enzyme [Auricularia subglabra TFB-10046 SS5]
MTHRIAVGGYTDALTVLSFSAHEKKLVPASAIGSTNASWLVPHPSAKDVWFTTSEVDPGFVRVLQFEGLEGKVLNEVATGGVHPTHIALTPDGKELFVANYSSGDVSVLPVLAQAPYLGAPSQPLIAFAYTSPAPGEPQAAFNPGRQESSHPHQVLPLENEVLVPDLGSDKVWRLHKTDGQWAVAGFIPFPRGSGPRHALVLGDKLYTLCELSLQLAVHTLRPLTESAEHIASLPTLETETAPKKKKKGVLLPSAIAFTSSLPPTPAPEETDAANKDLAQPIEPEGVSEPPPPPLAAEILAPPPLTEDNGVQYIYVSNRNEPSPLGDSIAVFTPHPDFKLVRRVHTGVQHLRGLNFSPGGAKFLALAGQNGGGVKIFERLPGGYLKELDGASVQEGEGGITKTTSVTWL